MLYSTSIDLPSCVQSVDDDPTKQRPEQFPEQVPGDEQAERGDEQSGLEDPHAGQLLGPERLPRTMIPD